MAMSLAETTVGQRAKKSTTTMTGLTLMKVDQMIIVGREFSNNDWIDIYMNTGQMFGQMAVSVMKTETIFQ